MARRLSKASAAQRLSHTVAMYLVINDEIMATDHTVESDYQRIESMIAALRRDNKAYLEAV